jgi:CTP synthase (UTP-ammonia lyase)
MPPPQLSEVVNALTRLQENIAILLSKPEGPTPHEVTDLATKPCESILLDLRELMVTRDACVQRAEEHARARLVAEITAFLHVSEQ